MDVDDRATVDADEAHGIYLFDEVLHRFADEMRPAARVQREVVALALYPLDGGEVEMAQAATRLDRNYRAAAVRRQIQHVDQHRERAQGEDQQQPVGRELAAD